MNSQRLYVSACFYNLMRSTAVSRVQSSYKPAPTNEGLFACVVTHAMITAKIVKSKRRTIVDSYHSFGKINKTFYFTPPFQRYVIDGWRLDSFVYNFCVFVRFNCFFFPLCYGFQYLVFFCNFVKNAFLNFLFFSHYLYS